MKVRLGFSVITTLDEPIVLVDEVLAVGDRAFREKCYERMNDMLSGGRTLFLVSHNEGDLRRFCTRGLYLRGGSLVTDGPLEEALEPYRDDTADAPEAAAVTAPVVVDPAPPDLATGLEALRGRRAARARGQLLLVARRPRRCTPRRSPTWPRTRGRPRPRSSAVEPAAAAGPAGPRRAGGGRRDAGAPGDRRRTRRSPARCGVGAADRDAAAAAADELAGAGPAARLGRRPAGATCSSAWCAAASGSARSASTRGRGGAAPAVDGTPRQAELDAMDSRAVHDVRFARATKADDGFVATFVQPPALPAGSRRGRCGSA